MIANMVFDFTDPPDGTPNKTLAMKSSKRKEGSRAGAGALFGYAVMSLIPINLDGDLFPDQSEIHHKRCGRSRGRQRDEPVLRHRDQSFKRIPIKTGRHRGQRAGHHVAERKEKSVCAGRAYTVD